MENIVKMDVFKVQGLEDPNLFWLLVEAMWKTKQINDNYMKKAQLVTTLQDIALPCYIKYNTTNPNSTLDEIKIALNT